MLLLFFIYPFAALLLAFKNYKSKESRQIVFFFLLLFGFTIILNNEELDSFRYALELESYHTITTSKFIESLSELYSNQNMMDLIRPFLNFIISRITTDYRVLFGIYAGIFGYFYLKSVNAAYDEYRRVRNLNSYFFFLFFVLALNPIFNINGFRYWTAAWIFFWGSYNFITSKEKRFLILAFTSIFFHFSFIFPFLIIMIYWWIGNSHKLYFLALVLSFVVSDFIFEILPSLKNILGSGFDSKISGYSSDARLDLLEEKKEYANTNNLWYITLPPILNFFYFLGVPIYLKFKKKNKFPPNVISLYSFTLLLAAAANTLSIVPSMGRFKVLVYLFSAMTIIQMLNYLKPQKLKWFTLIGIIPFSLSFALHTKLGLELINPWIFSFFPLPFLFGDISVYEIFF